MTDACAELVNAIAATAANIADLIAGSFSLVTAPSPLNQYGQQSSGVPGRRGNFRSCCWAAPPSQIGTGLVPLKSLYSRCVTM